MSTLYKHNRTSSEIYFRKRKALEIKVKTFSESLSNRKAWT